MLIEDGVSNVARDQSGEIIEHPKSELLRILQHGPSSYVTCSNKSIYLSDTADICSRYSPWVAREVVLKKQEM